MSFRATLFGVAALSIGFAAGAVNTTSADAGSLDGIYALAKRRLPGHAHAFSFSLADGEGDAFVISDTKNNGIHVECTTVNACARGLYQSVCVSPCVAISD